MAVHSLDFDEDKLVAMCVSHWSRSAQFDFQAKHMRKRGLGQPKDRRGGMGQFDGAGRDSRDFFANVCKRTGPCGATGGGFSDKGGGCGDGGMGFVLEHGVRRFPAPPQGCIAAGPGNAAKKLPAHTDPIHFTVDPGSDTIARG